MKSRKLRVYWQIFKDSHFRLDESGKVNGRFRPLGCQGSQIWVGIQSVGNPKWPLREALNLRIKILFGSIRTETSMKASNDICLFKTSTGVYFSQKFELWHRTFQNFVWSSKAILKEKSFSQCEYLSFLYFFDDRFDFFNPLQTSKPLAKMQKFATIQWSPWFTFFRYGLFKFLNFLNSSLIKNAPSLEFNRWRFGSSPTARWSLTIYQRDFAKI